MAQAFLVTTSSISNILADKPSGKRWNPQSWDSFAEGQVAFAAADQ
jgi:hypothetical protein